MNKIFIILFLSFYNLISIISFGFAEENKIKIGLLVPLTGDNSDIGKQIVKATRLALKDINSNKIEIFPKDTGSDPNKTLSAAIELSKLGINLVIGPIFYENLVYLDEVQNLTFLSFTNKSLPSVIIQAQRDLFGMHGLNFKSESEMKNFNHHW